MKEELNYWKFNREERSFCFLLGHLLLSRDDARAKFVKEVWDLNEANADRLEVYPEAAVLRDYWHQKVETGKEEALIELLSQVFAALDGPEPAFLEDERIYECLLKVKSQHKRIGNPARWSANGIGQAASHWRSKYPDLETFLYRVKWAFNAKPDFLFVVGQQALLMEVKVFSSLDIYKAKSDGRTISLSQLDVQRDIGQILRQLFDLEGVGQMILNLSGPGKLSYPDVTNVAWAKFLKQLGVFPETQDFNLSCPVERGFFDNRWLANTRAFKALLGSD